MTLAIRILRFYYLLMMGLTALSVSQAGVQSGVGTSIIEFGLGTDSETWSLTKDELGVNRLLITRQGGLSALGLHVGISPTNGPGTTVVEQDNGNLFLTGLNSAYRVGGNASHIIKEGIFSVRGENNTVGYRMNPGDTALLEVHLDGAEFQAWDANLRFERGSTLSLFLGETGRQELRIGQLSLETGTSTDPPAHLQLNLPSHSTISGIIPFINYNVLDGEISSASLEIGGKLLSRNPGATTLSDLGAYEFFIGKATDINGNHLVLHYNNRAIPEVETAVLLILAWVPFVFKRRRKSI